MEGVKTYKDLKSIANFRFEGYVWLSDEKEPRLVEDFDFSSVGVNPFIQEALLFCKEKNISVMVRHTGAYHITEYDLGALEVNGAELSKIIEYFPHRLNIGDKKVRIQQLWIPEEDPLCCDFPVLNLKAHIFVGFEPKGT